MSYIHKHMTFTFARVAVHSTLQPKSSLAQECLLSGLTSHWRSSYVLSYPVLFYTTAVTMVMMKMSTLSTIRIMPAHQLLRGE